MLAENTAVVHRAGGVSIFRFDSSFCIVFSTWLPTVQIRLSEKRKHSRFSGALVTQCNSIHYQTRVSINVSFFQRQILLLA